MTARFLPACPLADLDLNVAKRVEIPGIEALSIVRLPGGVVSALSDSCCHKDAKMSKGDIEDLGIVVSTAVGDGSGIGGICLRCPKHRKKFAGGLYFNALTGKSYVKGPCEKYKPQWRLPVYETRVEDGVVLVCTQPRLPSESDGDGREDAMHSAELSGKRDTYHPWTLAAIEAVSCDSNVYHFTRNDEISPKERKRAQKLAGHCWHVSIRLVDGGTVVDRDYTPVSDVEHWMNTASLDILIKIYKDGELTSRLAKLSVGTVLQISNPEPTLYLPLCTMQKPLLVDSSDVHDIFLVAGGTGIAPFVQLLDLATNREKRGAIFGAYTSVRISLLFSNHTQGDILFKLQLDEYAALFPAMFRVLYTLTSTEAIAKAEGPWMGAIGRVNPAMLKWLSNWRIPWSDCVGHGVLETIPPVPEDLVKSGCKYRRSVVLCGPQGMMDSVTAQLCACGVPADAIVALDT